jgi:maltose O-acetyltransferase
MHPIEGGKVLPVVEPSGRLDNYLHRVYDAILSSAFLRIRQRSRLMRMCGYSIGREVEINHGASFGSKSISLGDNVFINTGFFYDGLDRVVVGNHVSFGPFVRLITATHDIGPKGRRCTLPARTEPITIEEGCWIGSGVTVLPGVTIGSGCVIGAGALVRETTQPDGLYVGVPARRIKDLH